MAALRHHGPAVGAPSRTAASVSRTVLLPTSSVLSPMAVSCPERGSSCLARASRARLFLPCAGKPSAALPALRGQAERGSSCLARAWLPGMAPGQSGGWLALEAADREPGHDVLLEDQ